MERGERKRRKMGESEAQKRPPGSRFKLKKETYHRNSMSIPRPLALSSCPDSIIAVYLVASIVPPVKRGFVIDQFPPIRHLPFFPTRPRWQLSPRIQSTSTSFTGA